MSDDIPMRNMTNPCFLCKYCSQTTYMMARMHGICNRPKTDGKMSTTKGKFAYDLRLDESACGMEGKHFIDRNSPEEVAVKRVTGGPRHEDKRPNHMKKPKVAANA